MAAQPPFLLLTFADSVGNLKFVKTEFEKVKTLLREEKLNKGGFDFDPLEKATSDMIVKRFGELRQHNPCLFHFSGHAGSLGLEAQNGLMPADPLASFIKGFDLKIIFLNACGTATVAKKIFEKSTVKAIIATHCPVTDDKASEVSEAFYREFVINKKTLQEAFDALALVYANSLVTKTTARMVTMDEDPAWQQQNNFVWGLFVRNVSDLKLSMANIRSENTDELARIDKEIAELKKQLRTANANLEYIQKGSPPYLEAVEKIEKHTAELREKEVLRPILLSNDQEAAKNAKKKDNAKYFEEAIRRLNYSNQRDAWLETKKIGCYALSGDEYSVMDFLLEHFMTDNELIKANTNLFIYHTKSKINDAFWNKLVDHFKVPDIDTSNIGDAQKKATINYILAHHFCNSTELPRNNLVLKITGNEDINSIRDIMDECWRYFEINLRELNLWQRISEWEYRIAFVFVDDNISDQKKADLEAAEKFLTTKYKLFLDEQQDFAKCFEVVETVGTMTKGEIETWIRDNRLLIHRLELRTEKAKDIHDFSEGKIRKILQKIRKEIKDKVSDFPTLDQYNIHEPD